VASATGFEVKGLSESVKLLGSVDKELRREAGLVVRRAAVQLKRESQARLAATPGVRRRRYPMPKTAISHRATATKGVVGWNPKWTSGATIGKGKAGVGRLAEFGAKSQFIPYRGKGNGGRFVPQGSMIRRTFPVWRGNQFTFPKYGQKLTSGPGWIVQPVLRKRLGKIQEQVNKEMFAVFAKSARRAGVPRG